MPNRGKDFRQLVRELKRQDFHVELSPNSHYRVFKRVENADGEPEWQYATTLPSTSVSQRVFMNKVAELRKSGFKYKGR